MKLLWAAIAMTMFATYASASVRYDYTGLAVGSNSSPVFATSDAISSFFVLANIVTTGNFSANDLLDFAVQIGPLQLSKAQGADASAHLVFDKSGNVTSWSFVIGKYSNYSGDPALVEFWSNSDDLAPSGDRITIYANGNTQLGATSLPGMWSLQAAPIPEPNTVLLAVLGIAVIYLGSIKKNA